MPLTLTPRSFAICSICQEPSYLEEDKYEAGVAVRVCPHCKSTGTVWTFNELCDMANDYKALKEDYDKLYEEKFGDSY